MKGKFLSRFLSVLLAALMVVAPTVQLNIFAEKGNITADSEGDNFGTLNADAASVTADVVVSRIAKLKTLDGKYFTVSGSACTTNFTIPIGKVMWHDGCDNCFNSSVVNKNSEIRRFLGLSSTDKTTINASLFPTSLTGSSCVGFARFAQWYLFSNSLTDRVSHSLVVQNIPDTYPNIAKYARPGDYISEPGHAIIFINGNDSNYEYIDCNGQINGSGIDYSTRGYGNKTISIYRANNSPYTNDSSTNEVIVNFSAESSKWSIEETNAVISSKITVSGAASYKDATKVGVCLYDNDEKQIITKSEDAYTGYNGYLLPWYNIRDELGITLTPGTTYKFRFFVEIGGNVYYEDIRQFTTLGTSQIPVSTNFAAETAMWKIEETNAVISTKITVTGDSYKNATKIGVYLYDNAGNQLTTKSETPYTGYDGYLLSWYNINDELGIILKPGTTYKFRFFVVISGNTYYENMRSFTTTGNASYTITFNPNGGSVSTSNKTVTNNSTYGSLPTPTRTGYIFDGWYTSASGGTIITGNSTVNLIDNQTLYAHWTPMNYTVSYDANGGSGAPASQTKTHGVNLTLSTTKPTRTGYTFKGWSTANDSTVEYASGASYSANSGVTLYAVWQANTYTVKYNANGGSGSMSNSSHTYDTAKALTSNAFTRSGYSFLGWATDSSATSAKYTNGQSVKNLSSTNGATVNLYAVWSEIPKYTVSYNANGGSGAPASQTKTYGVNLTLSSTKPTKTGYTFKGWSTSNDSTVEYASGATYSANSGVTLYAVWQANTYTVKYNANGGSGSMSNSSHTYDTAKALTSNAFTRSGYSFLGWATDFSATSAKYTNGQSVKNLTSTNGATVNLYAVWSEIPKYTVSYNANGGSGAPESQTKTHDVNLTLSTTAPNREGYTFLGWSTSNDSTVEYASGASYSANADVTLYAVWQANTYTVSYDANGGSGAPESQTKTHGVNLTLSTTAPTRDGYTFKGWATSADGEVEYASGASYTANEDVTLYAVWKEVVPASYDAYIYTEASQSEVSVGGSLTYYIYLSGTYDGYSLVFDTKQSGLTVDSITGEAGVFADNLGDSWMVSVIGGLCKQSSEKTKIATVTLTVDADAAPGVKTFEFSDIAISNEIGDKATYTLESGSVTVASPVVEEPDEVEITSLKILDSSYDELDTIPDESFTAEVTVSNNSKDGAFTVMLCSYDEDGVLLDVRYFYANPAEGTSISLGASMGNSDGKTAKVKAMVFDTLKSFVPLTESAEITK